ncbi:MAG TPA: TadE family protein [Candidatus Dormibacteraeota bacterium]|nr:TadE family protein [Candidatus Dormibacteraeota bacterium]
MKLVRPLPDPPRKAGRERRSRGQALVEFAVCLPILILLAAGVLELGRGYSIGVATSDAARDGARYVAGKTTTNVGPGVANMCSLVTADLAAMTSNVSCATQVGHAPPFVAGTDFTKPAAGQAVVVVYCGASANCTGGQYSLAQTEVDVGVYFGFDDVNLFGGLITIGGTSRETSSW